MQPPRQSSDSLLYVAFGCGALGLMCLGTGVAGAVFWAVAGASGGIPGIVPASGSPPSPRPMPPSAEPPRMVRATVTGIEGTVAIAPGAPCVFGVERRDRDDGTYWCNAQVTCSGQLLYGGPTAGFFPCTLYEQPRRDIVGQDADTTSTDRDAAIILDTTRGTLELWDDGTGTLGRYHVIARVDTVE